MPFFGWKVQDADAGEVRHVMGNDENKNLTIADVAEALGVSKTTVSRAIFRKGKNRYCNERSCFKIHRGA